MNEEKIIEILRKGTTYDLREFLSINFHKIRHTQSFNLILLRLEKSYQEITEFKKRIQQLPNVEEMARMMHDTYEEQAKIVGWKTQESCQVKFDELPMSNKKVMYAVAKAIVKRIGK